MERSIKQNLVRGATASIVAVAAVTGVTLFGANGQGASVRCALLKNSGTEINRFEFHTLACPPDRPHKDVKFLPAPQVAPPSHDPAIQVLTGPTHIIEPTQVRETWDVRDKTAQELDQDADNQIDAARGTPDYHATWDIVNTLEALRVHLGLTKTQLDTLKSQNKLTETQYRSWLKQRKQEALVTRGGTQ